MARVHAASAMISVALIILFVAYAGAQSVVGSSEIHAPAVIVSNNSGVLTLIKLTVTNGSGMVNVTGPSEVGASTISSAEAAAQYASSYLNLDFNKYNFDYEILNSDAINVSGPSAGAAMTVLAISALSGRPLPSNFTMTGTIDSSGGIGLIGGVYDKTAAAKSGGMSFILVPATQANSNEDMLYALTQDEFGIPLVQVANVSQAVQFALYGKSVLGRGSPYEPFVNYNLSLIPNASITCSNCNESWFAGLTSYTFNITSRMINTLKPYGAFSNITQQLTAILNQSEVEAKKGYLYAGADQSFLDYITASYFSHHTITKGGGISYLDNVSNACGALQPPQLTNTNYEYVIGGELRQAWANYTISQDIGTYNATAVDTDGVLGAVYSGAEAMGWCSAAGYMYNISAQMGGSPVATSATLRSLAQSRIARAAQYGSNLYYATAESAFRSGNYPLAILDSDYAFALYNSTARFGNSTGVLLNMTARLADNASFGVWSTQFANEAEFYSAEARITQNASAAHGYASQAYSTALLASEISNDTSAIKGSLLAAPSAPAYGNYEGDFSAILTALTGIEKAMIALYVVLVGILIAVVATFIALLVLINRIARAERPKRNADAKRRQGGR